MAQFTVTGDVDPFLHISLKSGEKIYCEANAMVIPRDCLIPETEESDTAGVYVAKEGKAHRVPIKIGGSQNDRVWVKQGLSEGDLVITEIGPSLKEGVSVRVAK